GAIVVGSVGQLMYNVWLGVGRLTIAATGGDGLPCRGLPETCQRRLLPGVFHPLRPGDDLRPVAHVDDGSRRDQVEVMHLVAVRAENHEVRHVVTAAVAVEVSDFEDGGDAEPAMGTERVVMWEREFAVVDAVR